MSENTPTKPVERVAQVHVPKRDEDLVTMRHPITGDVQTVLNTGTTLTPLMILGYEQVRGEK